MGMIRYPLPITPAMLTPANQHYDKPRYGTVGDWSQGVTGNDIDVATRTEAVVSKADGGAITPYPTRTQYAKGQAMVPPLAILPDIGEDYGTYKGQMGRTGIIDPWQPYPDVNSPPVVGQISPLGGGVAGSTAVTIRGGGFIGATAVTFGGTGAASVVVVDANTITCLTPAHAAGAVDVIVTTPKGSSQTGVKFTYA